MIEGGVNNRRRAAWGRLIEGCENISECCKYFLNCFVESCENILIADVNVHRHEVDELPDNQQPLFQNNQRGAPAQGTVGDNNMLQHNLLPLNNGNLPQHGFGVNENAAPPGQQIA